MLPVFLVVTAVTLGFTTAAAHAGSVTYDDRGDRADASVALSKIRFINGRRAVQVRATHPQLDGDDVEASIGIDIPGPVAFYVLRGSSGHVTLSREDSDGEEPVVCAGARASVTSAHDGTAGAVRFHIPHRCLESSRRVRMAYALGSADYSSWEYAPNSRPSAEKRAYTRWIRRTR